ncbi:MAG: galactose mutarotase [Clostridia bacterium]|nr:galactose mutarotase [Clostridia bacterium]
MSIISKPFGVTKKGDAVTMFTMTNKQGASVSVIELGAIITSIIVPDKNGNLADVTLGFDTLDRYEGDHAFMGDIVGRYGNRIAKAKFTLDGVEYNLAVNDHANHLHGGAEGFNTKLWKLVAATEGEGVDSVKLHYLSPDMEENYPGNLDMYVTYSWDDDCNLAIRYEATTDKATHCNLTNHTYFNLAGHDHGTVLDHVVFIDSDVVTAVDSELIPTGGYMPVVGTPLDLREGMLLADGVEAKDSCVPMVWAGGYDHNFVLRKGSAMALAAFVYHEDSGRSMEVITDQPGVQLYTACTTYCEGGRGGVTYGNFSGLCLETQHFPDTPNHPNFPTTVLRPGEKYDTTTIYAFRVEEDDVDEE